MNLVIHNTLSGSRLTVELTDEPAMIGRPEPDSAPPAVPLKSPMVSREQALLKKEDGAWVLEHLGYNETVLGDLTLTQGKTYRIEPGNEIRIAEYVLFLEEEAQVDETPKSGLRDRELVEFEHDIHEKLLDRMDLRRGDAAASLESAETRARIEEHLDALLGEAIGRASEGLLEHIVCTNMHRRLTWMITAAGGRGGSAERRESAYGEMVFEQMISDILGRMANEMNLNFEPRRMQEDVAALDRGFEKAFENHALEFSEGVRKYVVKAAVKNDLLDVIFGLGPLQDLMEMDSISEVMVVSRSQIFIEKFGVIEDSRRAFFSDEMLMAVLERIVAPIGRRIDVSSPLVDAHLPDGSRVNAVIPPLALKGPCLTIRKFSSVPLGVDGLVASGALSEQMVKFLRACVRSHKNMIVSGGTGSGKTTLLNCLSGFIGPKERIVTIEDTAELQLQQSHVVTLESRPANLEGKGAITIRDLVKNALRMRPDRIIVGECRGAEALDMLQAMNTGHDGSMTTGHANTPGDMMLRIETMVLMGTSMPTSAIRDQIAAAVDVVVQLNRFPDGTRCVTHISEVIGIDEDTGDVLVEDIFVYQLPGDGQFGGGEHIHTGYIPSFIEEMLVKGVVTLENFF